MTWRVDNLGDPGRADLAALLDELLTRADKGAKLGLERVAEALTAVGDPQVSLPVVHVAGTNGKGSCCAMLEAIARQAGLRTGLFTSPHLSRFNERIRIDGAPIDDRRFTAVLAEALRDDLPRLSFFETLTVAAFLAMNQAQVDLAILEVGLGGRLDATNVLPRPLATAITSIGHDHEHFLGNDIADIAGEKAGILKLDVPAVLGPIDGEALTRIARVAREVSAQAPIWQVVGDQDGHRAEVEDLGHAAIRIESAAAGSLRLVAPDGRTVVTQPGLEGAHQAHNAAVAAGVVWQVADQVPALTDHLAAGLAATRWPGRLERLSHNERTVLLDCAHNEQAVAALCTAIGNLDPRRTLLVFGTMDGKPWRGMLARLAPLARQRIYCEPLVEMAGRKPAPPSSLAQAAKGTIAAGPEEALAMALRLAQRGDTILVTGSIFLVGAIRASLLKQRRDVIVPL